MKKLILLACITLLLTGFAKAQFKPLAEGPVFEEPEEGYAKLIQLKNGNTLFIHISVKKGTTTRMYDATHNEVGVSTLEPSFGKIKNDISAAFEINGDVVLTVSVFEEKRPTLYRLILDGKTGKLKDEKKLAQLDKVNMGSGFAVMFGGVAMPDFFIRKDPDSDNYAVVMFNSFVSDRSKRIEVVSYGSNNQETGRAFYSSPDEKYKYIDYVDMAVIGSDKVSVLAYGYNTSRSGGKESELILANLDKGAATLSFTELGFSKDLKITAGLTRYNPATKSLILLALTKASEKQKGLSPVLVLVNPYDRKIYRADEISPTDRINQFSKGGFTGLPQNLYVNSDGSFTVVSEEMKVATYSGQYASSTTTTLGDIAIVNYSKTGEFSTDYIIRKSQDLRGFSLSPFYLARRQGIGQYLKDGNQFKSFSYINGGNKNYIVFNDTERNNEKLEKGGLVTVSGVSGSDAFYYPVKGTEPTLTRDYLFGNPEKKKDHNLALFCISDYDKQSNIYTTLKLENSGGKKGVRVVWFQP